MTGVVCEYLSADRAMYNPKARQCADCDRHFVASEHKCDGDGNHYCPECDPVTPLREQVADAVAEHDAPPRMVNVDRVGR